MQNGNKEKNQLPHQQSSDTWFDFQAESPTEVKHYFSPFKLRMRQDSKFLSPWLEQSQRTHFIQETCINNKIENTKKSITANFYSRPFPVKQLKQSKQTISDNSFKLNNTLLSFHIKVSRKQTIRKKQINNMPIVNLSQWSSDQQKHCQNFNNKIVDFKTPKIKYLEQKIKLKQFLNQSKRQSFSCPKKLSHIYIVNNEEININDQEIQKKAMTTRQSNRQHTNIRCLGSNMASRKKALHLFNNFSDNPTI